MIHEKCKLSQVLTVELDLTFLTVDVQFGLISDVTLQQTSYDRYNPIGSDQDPQ